MSRKEMEKFDNVFKKNTDLVDVLESNVSFLVPWHISYLNSPGASLFPKMGRSNRTLYVLD